MSNKKKHTQTITLFDYFPESQKTIEDPPSFDPFLNIETSEEISEFEISPQILGEGGMGIVYEGTQRYPNRPIAVKRIKKRNPYLEELLKREAMITGKLSHPNIVPIHVLRPNGKYGPEVIMPLLNGTTLQEKLDEQEIELRKALHVLDQVSNGLRYAHAQNIFHRDIKPDNIMLGPYGDIYLVDWGIALDKNSSIESKTQMVGTPAYMPPEMISGKSELVDARTDIYLLGATLHYILTKKARHSGESISEVLEMSAKSLKSTYPISIFSELGHLANQCCDKDPDKRPQSVSIFQEQLHQSIAHWDVMEIISNGEKALHKLKEAREAEKGYPLFMTARVLFTQAHQSWPEAKSPLKGSIKAMEYMIELLIKAKEYKTAFTLTKELQSHVPNHPKLNEFWMRIKELDSKFQLLQETALENDLSISRSARVRIAQFLVILSFFAIGYACLEIVFYEKENNYTMLLWTMLAPTIALTLLLPFVANRLLQNKASRRAFINIFATMICILFNRILGILYEEQINRILTMDIFIFFLYWTHMTIQIRKAGYILLGVLIMGFVCISDPTAAFWMLNFATLTSTCATAYFWARGEL